MCCSVTLPWLCARPSFGTGQWPSPCGTVRRHPRASRRVSSEWGVGGGAWGKSGVGGGQKPQPCSSCGAPHPLHPLSWLLPSLLGRKGPCCQNPPRHFSGRARWAIPKLSGLGWGLGERGTWVGLCCWLERLWERWLCGAGGCASESRGGDPSPSSCRWSRTVPGG